MKCNQESVVLEPVVKDVDVSFVKESLADFVSYTGSKVAAKILENWDTEGKRIIKVRIPLIKSQLIQRTSGIIILQN